MKGGLLNYLFVTPEVHRWHHSAKVPEGYGYSCNYGVEGEIYVTAPGAEIDEGHELVQAVDEAHEQVFGARPERDVTRWFSDASALSRYGIPTLNYGTSTGLMDVELGENLEIEGLVKTAQTYALVAMRICGAA